MDGALPSVPTPDLLRAGDLLEVPIVVVRTLQRDGDDRLTLCELLDRDRLPPGTRWQPMDLPPGDSASAPWLEPGWLADTLGWLDEVAPGPARTPVRQLRHWGLSAVIRVGELVVKQTLPLFGAEPAIMRALNDVAPGIAADVVAHDAGAHRWVMTFVEGREPRNEGAALCALAELQQSTARELGRFHAAGAGERLLERLPSEVAALADRDDVLFARDWSLQSTDGRLPPRAFGDADKQSLLDALPEIARRVERLARLPSTLVHGDFHVHNVVRTDVGHVIFDWANACIAHPFMDLPMWLQWAREPDASVGAYLRSWGAGHLAWADAHPVALLHHALTLLPLVDAHPAARADWAAGVQKRVLQALALLSR
jgi:fructosamine-3-kinase